MLNANTLPRPASKAATWLQLMSSLPRKSWRRGGAATMLALMLCCAGCAHRPPLASVNQGSLGNALLSTLPARTVLRLPHASATARLHSLLVNEVTLTAPDSLTVNTPLKICTPAYLAERDLRELALLQQIEQLRLENQALRLP